MIRLGRRLTSRYWISIVLLLSAAAVSVVWLMQPLSPSELLAVPLVLVLAAGGLALVGLRAGRATGESVRLELSRLRIDRLREYVVRAIGYHYQMVALTETFPQAMVRRSLADGLPTLNANLRALYDLCLAIQAVELGEQRPAGLATLPPAAMATLASGADGVILAALDVQALLYATLRRAWSEGPLLPDDVATLLADVASMTANLRECAQTFAPTLTDSPPQPAGQR